MMVVLRKPKINYCEHCSAREGTAHAKNCRVYVAELEAKVSRWIPVSERLPEEGVPVLVVGQPWPDQIRTALLAFDEPGWHWEVMTSCFALNDADAYEFDDDYEFTHWMPLPEPPTGEE